MQWTEKQQQVIDSRDRNLLVSAAAGSGKTAVLVERIIQMISQGDPPLDIDRLLVMTFTNAAAAEMRERIQAAVDKRLREDPGNEHLWLQAALISQAQITTIDSFCLHVIRNHYDTLDIDPAFRIGDEGELALLQADVMREVLEERYASGDENFARFVECFGRGRSDKGIEEVISQAWRFAQSHPWPLEWLDACARELGGEDLEHLGNTPWMRVLFRDAALLAEELKDQLEEALLVCQEEDGPSAYEPMIEADVRRIGGVLTAARSEDFAGLCEALSSLSFDRLAATRSKDVDQEKKAFVSSCRDRAKKALGKLKDLYGSQSPEEACRILAASRPPLLALFDVVRRYDEAFREAKKERNILDFNDLEHLALQVLWQEPAEGGKRIPSPAAEELREQFAEILVDEYQDSNLVQEALIEAVSRERLGNPNVFMVGDVKQSIYRFRLAMPELFMVKYDTYSRDPDPYMLIELQQNFRSRDTVLACVNHIFFQIMTKSLGGIRYTKETALYPGADFPPAPEGERAGGPAELLTADTGAQSLRVLDEEELDYTSRELEAKMAAQKIRELVDGRRGLSVWDKSGGPEGKGAYRRAQYGDIVILLRSMAGWSEVFVNVLMNEGIPAYAQTTSGYFDTVEAETMLSLLAVVDNPMQDIPLAAVLRSPIVGMTDEEMAWMMAAYKRRAKKGQDRGMYAAWKLWAEAAGSFQGGDGPGDGGAWGADSPVDSAAQSGAGSAVPDLAEKRGIPAETAARIQEKLGSFGSLLSRLREASRYLPISELLQLAYRESGYYDYVSAMPGGLTRRANLDMLAEKARGYEAASYKGLFHFVRYIEKLKKYDQDFGEASGEESQKGVRIMSIHKSKGLEFPIVILAGLGKRFNKQDAYSQILLDPNLGAASDCVDLEHRVRIPTLKKQVLKRRLELEALGEELRILYVAMTRAKEKLIMTGTDKALVDKWEKWSDVPRIRGQIPYSILASASSCLDWLLMARQAVPESCLTARQMNVGDLIGREVSRQAERGMVREALLGMDTEKIYDPETEQRLRTAAEYVYPYQDDTRLFAMVSVTELKKQSQLGRSEDTLGTGREDQEGQVLKELLAIPQEPSQSARRGTAYHTALEHLPLGEVKSLGDTRAALESIHREGFLDDEAYGLVDPEPVWKFADSPLGRRMAAARTKGCLYREQQFMIGIPARELGRGDSEELVLIQGIIDAYLEEEDGLVVIDYKTDRVPPGAPEKGAAMLADRYRVQLDYYEKALNQLTGKPVKERIIYSLALGMSIAV